MKSSIAALVCTLLGLIQVTLRANVDYVPLNTPRPTPAKLAGASTKSKTPAKAAPKPSAKSSAPIRKGQIDFLTQVRPILAANCFSCHGPEKNSGQLRLDAKQLALKGGVSGPAIVPGNSQKSYMLQRILGHGDEAQMPIGKPPLTAPQVAIIRSWIDQGAVWPEPAAATKASLKQHWAFIKPLRPTLPPVKRAGWVRNPLDHFILARLEQHGLSPSPEATRATLLRRVSLDLTGLPPSPEEVDAFIADQSPNAYEKVVDRLLASPHYGERWGRHWLDLARYADTNGYEKDRARTIWPYRDWVINALNSDMPFDQFTVEQLAGDMLPNATPSQKIATGFHRNTMLNEEGGIDVEEFRDKAVVDRVQTTATAWLGMTLQCAQCHNHKYDPVSQKEYYQFYALLNNADEPEFQIPDSSITARREESEAKIRQIEADYEKNFPAGETSLDWQPLSVIQATSTQGATLTAQNDGAILVSGALPDTDTYTVVAKTEGTDITAFRLEALTDASLSRTGPGRLGADGNGNFVVTDLKITATPATGGEAKVVTLTGARADVLQPNFEVAKAIDGDPKTGWAIADASGPLNQNRTATFTTQQPVGFPQGTTFTITIDQQYHKHTLGRFRLSAGRKVLGAPAMNKGQFLQAKLTEWEQQVAAKSARWTPLEPTKFSRNYHATITKLDDSSLLFTGDNYYRDEYKLEFQSKLKTITAIRLEVLPHATLPNGGPGRSPSGGFLLSEFTVSAASTQKPDALMPVALQAATADYGSAPPKAIDGKKDTHWTASSGDAKPHAIVFRFKEPLVNEAGARLAISILSNYHQQENIGRLRISATSDAGEVQASGLPADLETIIVTPKEQRTTEQKARLQKYFLSVTPLLDERHKQIAALRTAMPRYQTTMIMQERDKLRPTQIHRRGEFLNVGDEVTPSVPSVLPPLPASAPRNRLSLARWLVSPDNPLVSRVVMNRSWTAFFGRGIVNSVEDFGTMGEAPSHPQLLDWLATEFIRRKWSMKAMHRLVVTSATYRQSSQTTPRLLKDDPANVWLARGPRVRVEAEIVRDIALVASGLLHRRIGGPSVYPPQPDGIVDLSWGAMTWPTSQGEERYRRGLYTFLKRTSPYPGLTILDGTNADVTCARRNRSNTPLQALATLNDSVFVEAAQAMARRVLEKGPADVSGRMKYAFRLCLSREPDAREQEQLTAYYQTQLARFRDGSADASTVALSDPKQATAHKNLPELAAWTVVSRILLNLDETITKE